MESKLRQMTLEEIQISAEAKIGKGWRVTVTNDANGKVQIRSVRKTP